MATLNILIDENIKRAARIKAAQDGTNLSEVLRRWLKHWLKTGELPDGDNDEQTDDS